MCFIRRFCRGIELMFLARSRLKGASGSGEEDVRVGQVKRKPVASRQTVRAGSEEKELKRKKVKLAQNGSTVTISWGSVPPMAF